VSRNLLDPSNRRTLIIVVVAAAVVACCCVIALGAGVVVLSNREGACVVRIAGHPANSAHCFNGWEKQECLNLSYSAFYRGASCGAFGFTKQCPRDPAVWRYPEYRCD
jgi:hypothetical protein